MIAPRSAAKWFAALSFTAASCAAPQPEPAASDGLLRRASRVFDGRTGAEIGWETALARAAAAEAVFLGETHLDRLTHEAELAFLTGLAAARDGRVALALEMFERDVQPVLEDYLAGRVTEEDFLARARPWPNYRTDYRPMIEFARARGLPVWASNFPADLRRKLARGGAEAHSSLTPEERAWMPAPLIENPPEYWARVEQATLGHGALGMGAGAGSRLYDGQNLWDNAMGETVARALDRDPGRLVVHVNGGFHSAEWQGTVWQLLQRRPATRVLTVAIETTHDLAATRVAGTPPEADLVVVVEARARSADGGVRAVSVAREHEFRLQIPPGAARDLPLLIWLGEDDQTAADALALWEPALSGAAAILALEPSFPYVGEDGRKAGRWFFSGDAAEGGGLALAAVARALAEAAQPGLPLDESRIVLAGEGAGGTMAIFATRYARDQAFHTLAFSPAAGDEFGLMAMPLRLPEDRPQRALTIHDANPATWEALAASGAGLRLATEIVPLPAEAAAADSDQIAAVRTALGLPPVAASAAADATLRDAPAHPRGRFAARVLARKARAAGLTEAPNLTIRATAFADGAALPLSSGAFGGTTILVLPNDASEEDWLAWKALEEPDVLQKRSRFHRLRIARGTGEEAPRAVIERLRGENPQRRDFLLVPATFCAAPAELRALRESLGSLAGEVRLEFLPGLGDRLPLRP